MCTIVKSKCSLYLNTQQSDIIDYTFSIYTLTGADLKTGERELLKTAEIPENLDFLSSMNTDQDDVEKVTYLCYVL